jgi:hypothetical protein
MTLQEFINANAGKKVASRGGITGQCVSLSQAWAEVNGVTGTPVFPVAFAYQMVNSRPDFFTWEANKVGDPNSKPQPGDIVVFNQSYGGGAGHTGVVVSSDGYTMAVYQQNDPIGSVAYTKTYGFGGCSGWLRLKQTNQGGTMATKVTKETLRMIHSEMEGWPYNDVHAGKFDAQFAASWGGKDLEACMWEKWNKNGAWRNEREAALDYWRNKKKSAEDQVKSQQIQIDKQAAEIASLKAQIVELGKQPVVTEDQAAQVVAETLKPAASFWSKVWAIIKGGTK